MSSVPKPSASLKVMLVDDSTVVRGLLRRIIETSDVLEIVTTAGNGVHAVSKYETYRPDVVLMDIEMPEMDGLTALKEIIAMDPQAKVIMCSSLTQKGAETTIKALEIGAIDCLAKPSSTTIDRDVSFEDELRFKLITLAGKRAAEKAEQVENPVVNGADSTKLSMLSTVRDQKDCTLQPFPANFPVRFPLALAIGSSTGGPKALAELLAGLDKNLTLPVFITQHIPANFSKYLAENLSAKSGMPAHEAAEGMMIQPGHIYVAPGSKHMGIHKGAPKTIKLIDTAPVNFCKPAIDVMLREIHAAYGGHMLTVLLTGMGSDGKEACAHLIEVQQHNIILAQDEASSVVWGIPGAAAKEGLCHAILPLAELAPAINRLVQRKKPV